MRHERTFGAAVAITVMELRAGPGRRPVIGKILLDRNKNCNLHARGNFGQKNRDHRWDFTNPGMNMPLGKGNNRAIVVIRDRAAMEPFVERRANFRRGHEQPDKQGQQSRRAVYALARSAAHFERKQNHAFRQKPPNLSNNQAKKPLIANHLQFARFLYRNQTHFPLLYRIVCPILTVKTRPSHKRRIRLSDESKG
jgi:hypothetical protein